MTAQFLVEGVRIAREAGVFVTFEESPADIRRNMYSLRWDIARWENEGIWLFVDASPQLGEELQISGGYDLGALLAHLKHAVRKIDARRVSFDSLSGHPNNLPKGVAKGKNPSASRYAAGGPPFGKGSRGGVAEGGFPSRATQGDRELCG